MHKSVSIFFLLFFPYIISLIFTLPFSPYIIIFLPLTLSFTLYFTFLTQTYKSLLIPLLTFAPRFLVHFQLKLIQNLTFRFYWSRKLIFAHFQRRRQLQAVSSDFSSYREFIGREIDFQARNFVKIDEIYVKIEASQGVIFAPVDAISTFFGDFSHDSILEQPVGLQISLENLIGEGSEKRFGFLFSTPLVGECQRFISPFNFLKIGQGVVIKSGWFPLFGSVLQKVKRVVVENTRTVISGEWGGRAVYIVVVHGVQLPELTNCDFYAAGQELGVFCQGIYVIFELRGSEDFEVMKSGRVKAGEEVVRIVQSGGQ